MSLNKLDISEWGGGSRSNFNTSLTLSEKGEAIQNWCFSPGTPVSSTNKTDRLDITAILLKVAFYTIPLPSPSFFYFWVSLSYKN